MRDRPVPAFGNWRVTTNASNPFTLAAAGSGGTVPSCSQTPSGKRATASEYDSPLRRGTTTVGG